MALELAYELPSGVSGNYWRITSFAMDRVNSTVVVKIYLYRDEEARTEGKQPMEARVYVFSGDDFADFDTPEQDAEDVNVIATAYAKIKANADAFFAEAEDV